MRKNALLIIAVVLLGIGLLVLYLHKDFVSEKQEVELIKRVNQALSREKEEVKYKVPSPKPQLKEELVSIPKPIETKPIAPPKEPKITKKEKIERLVKKIDSNDQEAQKQAADELTMMGKEAVPELIEALPEASIPTTCKIVHILGKIGDSQAIEAIEEVLDHEDASVRRDAVEALGEIGDIKAEDALISSLLDTDSSVREEAQEALKKLESNKAVVEEKVTTLAKKIGSDDWQIRAQAADEFVKRGKEAVPELIEAFSDSTSIAATGKIVHTLGRIGDSQATEAVKEVLINNKNAYVRRNAAEALGRMGNAQAEDVLIKALSDPDGSVRQRAVAALGKIKSAKAVEPLIKKINEKEEGRVNLAAVEALGELKDKRATQRLLEELGAGRNFFYKNKVVYALGEIGDGRALDPLNNHLDNLRKNKPTEEIFIFQWQEAVGITEEAIHKIIPEGIDE